MENTVLILGAGSSYDYGYQTGAQLTEEFYTLGIGHQIITDALKYELETASIQGDLRVGFEKIIQHFFASRSKSIDAWLAKEENKQCVEAAKFLIAYFISKRERQPFSKGGFFQPIEDSKTSNHIGGLKRDWYQLLFNELVSDKFEDFGKANRNLCVVTFNYDRSLEYFLINALQSTYVGRSRQECYDQLKEIDIYHVYGAVGDFSFLTSDRPTIPYRSPSSKRIDEIFKRAEGIKIIPELRSVETDTIEKIRSKLEAARNVFFIGFSYDRLNLELLGFPIQSTQNSVILMGSALNLEGGEIEVAHKRVRVNCPHGGTHLLICTKIVFAVQ